MPLPAMVEDLPKPVWIAFMILGFIAFWPIGLAILGYMYWSGIMGCWKGNKSMRQWRGPVTSFRSSGNKAFDEYREATLNRLKEEQDEFEMFLERLKQAKDQKEFDQFMAERNGAPSAHG
ncbi:MAG: DUF2852 domain-containing protein [Methyloligellaceae bacterium]